MAVWVIVGFPASLELAATVAPVVVLVTVMEVALVLLVLWAVTTGVVVSVPVKDTADM